MRKSYQVIKRKNYNTISDSNISSVVQIRINAKNLEKKIRKVIDESSHLDPYIVIDYDLLDETLIIYEGEPDE